MTTIKYEILWETKKPEARSGGVKVACATLAGTGETRTTASKRAGLL